MCLLGSVVIVLHAPPDKPVERIDEILAYAVKPGTFPADMPWLPNFKLIFASRIPPLLPGSGNLLLCDDLPSRPGLRKEEPSHFYLNLFHCRLSLRDVCQGLWYCGETDFRRQ